MKSGSAECIGRGGLGGRVQLFGRIAFLVAGYLLLSPACCREGLKWLRTVLEQALPAWLAEAVRSLASPGSPAGVLLGALPAAVAAAVLAGAVVCVCGLFVEWRREKTLFVLAMGIAVLAAVLVKWGEATGKAQEAGTWFWPALHKAGVAVVACRPYVDALYAGVCLILLAGWMASLLYQWMKNGGGRATGLLGLVVAGCVLYEVLDRQGVFESRFRAERWVRPVQVLDQVFGVLDKPKDGIQLDALHPGLAGAYYLFHAMLFFFGALVVAGAVSKPLVNAILLRFMRTPDCVFWGVSPEALALARSLSEKRKGGKGRRLACVFALEKAETAEKSELERSGFLWVVEGREVPSVTVRRARKHFFLAEEGSDNIAHAERLAKAAKSEPEAWVRIDDESDDSWLHRWADQAYIQKTLDVHIVRETSLAADLLLQKHPMLEAPGVSCEDGTAFMEKNGEKGKAAFRLLLVGFGWQGRMILNRTICDAQAPGTTFEADVVDKDDSAMDLYALRNPDAMDAYNIRPVKLDAAGRAFYGWLDGHLENWKDITRIVVTTGDDSLNLDVAMYIDRRVRELEARNGTRGACGRNGRKWAEDSSKCLFVRVRHQEKFAKLGGVKGLPFTPFGSVDEIYSREALFDSEIDRIAQIMNAKWFVKDDQMPTEEDIRKHWREASFFNRESSRASAMGVRNLWRLSGCADREKEMTKAREKEKEALERAGKTVPNEKPETEEARLARCQAAWQAAVQRCQALEGRLEDAEHLRWMAFHLVRGVRPWDWRAEPGLWRTAGGKVKANLREGANRHAALVPTARLPELELWLEKTYWEEAAEKAEAKGRPEAKAWFKEYAAEVAARQVPEAGGAIAEYETDYPLWYRNKCVRVYERWSNGEKEWASCGFEADVEGQVKRFVERAFSGDVPSTPPARPALPSETFMSLVAARQAAFPGRWQKVLAFFWWIGAVMAKLGRFCAKVVVPQWAKKALARVQQNIRAWSLKHFQHHLVKNILAWGLKHFSMPWIKIRNKMHGIEEYGKFLEDADDLFGKAGKGEGAEFEPDRRFRTPGDMVDNDARIVMHVPEYLGNQNET